MVRNINPCLLRHVIHEQFSKLLVQLPAREPDFHLKGRTWQPIQYLAARHNNDCSQTVEAPGAGWFVVVGRSLEDTRMITHR